MLADSLLLGPGLLAIYGLVAGAVVTVFVSRRYYQKTLKDIRDEGSALSTQNSQLQEQLTEVRSIIGDVLISREDRVEEISGITHVDKSVVRRVVNAMSDELLVSLVRTALLEVQDAQGRVDRQRLFGVIANEAPPGTVAQSRRILNDMRERGEVEFAGDISSAETIQLVRAPKAPAGQR